jgi:Phage-related protein
MVKNQTNNKRKKDFPVVLLHAAREELFGLSAIDRAEFIAAIDDFEEFGPHSLQVNTEKIQGNMYEIKTHSQSHWLRGFYFHFHKGLWLITHFFAKKTNKTPKANVELGLARYQTFLAADESKNAREKNEQK